MQTQIASLLNTPISTLLFKTCGNVTSQSQSFHPKPLNDDTLITYYNNSPIFIEFPTLTNLSLLLAFNKCINSTEHNSKGHKVEWSKMSEEDKKQYLKQKNLFYVNAINNLRNEIQTQKSKIDDETENATLIQKETKNMFKEVDKVQTEKIQRRTAIISIMNEMNDLTTKIKNGKIQKDTCEELLNTYENPKGSKSIKEILHDGQTEHRRLEKEIKKQNEGFDEYKGDIRKIKRGGSMKRGSIKRSGSKIKRKICKQLSNK